MVWNPVGASRVCCPDKYGINATYINVSAFKAFPRVLVDNVSFMLREDKFSQADIFIMLNRFSKFATALSSTVYGATFAWMLLFRLNFNSLFFLLSFFSAFAFRGLSILQIPPSENFEHSPILSWLSHEVD